MAAWFWLFWTLSGLFGIGGVTLLYFALLHDRARGRRRCPKCWYDMGGVPGLICPECGRAVSRERSLRRIRRKWWRASLAACILTLAYACGVTPHVMSTGQWWTALPRPVLVVVLQFYDDDQLTLLRHVAKLREPQTGQGWWAAPAELEESTPVPSSIATSVERLFLARRCAAILNDPTAPAPPASSRSPLAFIYPAPSGLGNEDGSSAVSSSAVLASAAAAATGPLPLNRYERRDVAIDVLAKLGPQARPAGASLLGILVQEPSHSSLAAALANCASSRSVARTLGKTAREDEGASGDVALSALIRAGESARPARDDIRAVLLAAPSGQRARDAAQALVSMCEPDDAIGILADAMKRPIGRVRVGVVWGLGKMRSRASRAVELIAEAARDRVIRCPADCVQALLRLGDPALPLLTEFVTDPDLDLAAEAAAGLWSFGPKAAPAVPALTRALASNDVNLRNHASVALGMIGADAEPSRPAIERMLSDPDPRMRAAAADALRLMRQTPRPQPPNASGQRARWAGTGNR